MATAPEAQPHENEKPHFEIEVEDGRGRLHLRPRTFFGWLRVAELKLRIPSVAFPLDITGGMAHFRRQRCVVEAAAMRVEPKGFVEVVERRRALLGAAGFENVGLGVDAGVIEITARARLREWTAELIVRLAAEPNGRSLRLRVRDCATLGYIRRPAPLLAHDLLCILAGASDQTSGAANPGARDGVSAVGLGLLEAHPLDWFAVAALAPAGWRLPELDGVHLAEVAIDGHGIDLRWSRPQADASQRRTATHEWLDRAVDEALLRNDVAGAAAACRLELTRRPERAEELTARLLNILAARDASLRDAEKLAEESLQRWPDFVAAELTLGAVETARARPDEAARHFAEAARLAEGFGDLGLSVRAAAAAARQLQARDPDGALRLYEGVLHHRPFDQEAMTALAEIYTATRRFAELRELLRARTEAATGRELVETHLRVAELSFTHLADAASARRHLAAASELAPLDRRIWELLARVCTAAGDQAESIVALERLAVVLAHDQDELAQARVLLRTANAYEDAGDDAAALERYRQGLALLPDDAGALERFAVVAARHGDGADAIDACRRVLDHPRAGNERRRRVAQQLLQLYVIIGDVDEARRLLPSLQDEPSPDVLMGLARLFEASDAPLEANDLWRRAAAQLEGQHAAAAEVERARVCHAAGLVDEERDALARVFGLAPTAQDGLAAAAGLIRLARQRGDRADEAAWLDRLLLCDPRPAGHHELVLRRAQLFLDAGNAAAALDALDGLRAEGKESTALSRLLADVRGAVGDHAGRAELLERLARDADASERARLLVDAAEARLAAGDLDGAAAAAAAAAPSDARVRALLAEIAWQKRDWEEVARRYRELLDDGDGPRRVEHARRLATAEDWLGASADAVATLARALDYADAAGAPLHAVYVELAHLYERAGDVAEAVAQQRRGGNDARLERGARVELLRAAAALLHRRLGQHEAALEALGEAHRLDAADLATLDALDAVQSEIEDYAALLTTLEAKLAAPHLPAERRQDALERLATLAERRQDGEIARRAYRELYALEPEHARALAWLAADAAARGDDDAAASFDTALAARQSAPAFERREARVRSARRAKNEGRIGDAERDLWAAVELTAKEEQSPLFTELEALYAEAERWADLAVVLNHHAPLVDGDDARLLVELRRLSILTHQLATPAAAIEAAQAALERHGRVPSLLEAVADAARAAGDKTLLHATLTELAALRGEPPPAPLERRNPVNLEALVRTVLPELTTAPAAKSGVAAAEAALAALSPADILAMRDGRRRLGEAYRAAGRHADAFRELDAVLAEEPSNLEVVRMLIEVAEADARFGDAAGLYVRSSHLVDEPRQRAELLVRAGDLLRDRLGDREAASARYLEAFDLDATHAPTLRRLVDYFFDEADYASAAEMAALLDEENGFATAETTMPTRAKAAFACALAGDTARAFKLGVALDRAAIEAAERALAAKGMSAAAVAQASKQITRAKP